MTLSKLQLTERLPLRSQAAEILRLKRAPHGSLLYKKFYYEDTSIEETLLKIADISYRVESIGSASCYRKI